MSWYQIHYVHLECNAAWVGQWSCACNDRCPVCDREIEAEDYIDLTATIDFDGDAGEWVVLISPPEAETTPCYRQTHFKERRAAEAFLAASVKAIDRAVVR